MSRSGRVRSVLYDRKNYLILFLGLGLPYNCTIEPLLVINMTSSFGLRNIDLTYTHLQVRDPS